MSGPIGTPIQGESYSVPQLLAMLMNVLDVSVEAGETNLTVANIPSNIIYISADAAESIASIDVVSDGYIILIIAEDNNLTIQSNAQLDLNSLPAGTDFAMVQHDILVLICKNGVYQELFRTEKN